MGRTAEYINKAKVQGNVVQDPVFNKTDKFTYLKFSVATKKQIQKRAGGEWIEKTEWHSILAWGKLAEESRELVYKGALVCVEGELQTSNWQDKKHGDKRYKTEIVAYAIDNVEGCRGSADDPAPPEHGQQPHQETQSAPSDDDLPF